MTAPTVDADAVRHDLYEIMNRDLSFEEKAARALELGERYLGVDNAHLTRIETGTERWEAVVSTDDADGDFPPGLVLDLETTYCRRTAERESSVALHDATEQGWADDPAVDAHGLHCYHGTPLTVDGELYGTVCFVSSEARSEPFAEHETMFAELIARMLEHELERCSHEAETRKRANLVTVLSRVLRHNLRNDMTVVRGRVNELTRRIDADSEAGETIRGKVDDLIEISEKARELEQIVSAEFERETVDIADLVDDIAGEVASAYPEASVSVDGPEELPVAVMPSLGTALRELIQNAAKHAGDRPSVDVTVRSTQTAVEIAVADDGPGLPDHERSVLDDGVETPLVHGSGLGLWTVYWVVSSHDGEIETNVSGSGTRVTVSLPVEATDPLSNRTDCERELERGYDRYRAAFEGAFDAMLLFDDEGHILDANPAAADFHRLSRDELLGRSLTEFLPADSAFDGEAEPPVPDERDRGTTTLVLPDGTERTVEYAVTPNVVPGQHLTITRDVTERESRREDLERTTRRLEAVIEACPDPLVVLDTDGTVERWNSAAESVFGWSETEVLGERPPIVPEAGAEFFEERLAEAGAGQQFSGLDVSRETRDGDRIDVSVSTAPIRTTDGEVAGTVGVLREIADRLAREREVTDLCQQLQGVLDTVPAAVYMKDPDGRYLLMNRSTRELFGLDPDCSVTGRTDRDILPDDVARTLRRNDQSVLESGDPVTVVEEVPDNEGETRPHLTIKRPVYDDDNDLYGVCGVSMDLSAFRDVDRALSEFVD